jgi:hypothetical protein
LCQQLLHARVVGSEHTLLPGCQLLLYGILDNTQGPLDGVGHGRGVDAQLEVALQAQQLLYEGAGVVLARTVGGFMPAGGAVGEHTCSDGNQGRVDELEFESSLVQQLL